MPDPVIFTKDPPRIVRMECSDASHRRGSKQGHLQEDCGWYGRRWTCLACGRVSSDGGSEFRYREPLPGGALAQQVRDFNLKRARRIIDQHPATKGKP